MPPGILKSSQPIGDDPKLCIYIYIFDVYSCTLLIYNKPNKRIYWTSDKSSPSRSHGMSPGILMFTQKMSGKCIFVLRNLVYWLVVWNIFFRILGMSSSQLTSIFFRGVETTNQYKHVSGRVAGVLLFRSVENCPFLWRRQLGLMVCPFCWATPSCSPAHDERTFFLPYNGSLCFTFVRYIWVLFINVIQQVSQIGIKKVDVSLFHPSLPDYKHMLTSLEIFSFKYSPSKPQLMIIQCRITGFDRSQNQ